MNISLNTVGLSGNLHDLLREFNLAPKEAKFHEGEIVRISSNRHEILKYLLDGSDGVYHKSELIAESYLIAGQIGEVVFSTVLTEADGSEEIVYTIEVEAAGNTIHGLPDYLLTLLR